MNTYNVFLIMNWSHSIESGSFRQNAFWSRSKEISLYLARAHRPYNKSVTGCIRTRTRIKGSDLKKIKNK